MTAIGLHKFGSADVLERLTVPVPEIAPDALLVRVIAAGFNPANWRFRNGQFKSFIRKFPFIPGADIAGIDVKLVFAWQGEPFALLDVTGAYTFSFALRV